MKLILNQLPDAKVFTMEPGRLTVGLTYNIIGELSNGYIILGYDYATPYWILKSRFKEL